MIQNQVDRRHPSYKLCVLIDGLLEGLVVPALQSSREISISDDAWARFHSFVLLAMP